MLLFLSDHGKNGKREHYTTPQMVDDDLEELIEDILHEDDSDNNGYVDFAEFKVANKHRGGFDDADKPYSPDRFGE